MCADCHGHIASSGRPVGAKAGARDLTSGAWQKSVADADIAQTIRLGKGQMPAFRLSSEETEALIRLIRSFAGPR